MDARADRVVSRVRAVQGDTLRGLREPQPVFQVEAPDLPARFPPLRTRAAPGGKADDRR